MEPEPGVGFTLQMGAVAAAGVAIMVAIILQLTLARRTEHVFFTPGILASQFTHFPEKTSSSPS